MQTITFIEHEQAKEREQDMPLLAFGLATGALKGVSAGRRPTICEPRIKRGLHVAPHSDKRGVTGGRKGAVRCIVQTSAATIMSQDPSKGLAQPLAEEFCAFVNRAVSPYHAVHLLQNQLDAGGFVRLSEKRAWSKDLKPGGKYYFVRNGSTLCAFTVGGKWDPSNDSSGVAVFGAHTDSPCFKVKPNSDIQSHGYVSLGVECYGGGLWYTWFDRDLTLAGRVLLSDGKFHLVHINRPVLRIPSLAIHLNREVNTAGFQVNKEKHTVPILAMVKKELETAPTDEKKEKQEQVTGIKSRASPLFLQLICSELGVELDEIRDFEFVLSDTQPASTGGASNDFIFSPRLDNLASTFASFKAFMEPDHLSGLAESEDVHMVTYFDHEEVGSDSAHGAGSPLVSEVMRRICRDLDNDAYAAVLHRSFFVSADMAHAIHPNYADKHEPRNRPEIGKGLVIKTNQNQRYATTAYSGYVMRECGRRAAARCEIGFVPIQEFVVPNDVGCGSTIGPIIAANCGIRTVDVGQPQLAMHSIREMCGVCDLWLCKEVYKQFFLSYADLKELDDDVQV
ncbi:Aspartyl aminopeptidase [Porphyridium purpureum]|uniref:aspartyl aminopeptidase n=1 Tax=Porphyridium purpureum TaxID=35688 RepID=A0A5J4YUM1_PORPP|nr:Aspartyl aminopeptidase [Porphyridium purpureum]|eukprot:POR2621..scf227_4